MSLLLHRDVISVFLELARAIHDLMRQEPIDYPNMVLARLVRS